MYNYFLYMLIVLVYNGIFVKMKFNEKYSYIVDGVLICIVFLILLIMEFILIVY